MLRPSVGRPGSAFTLIELLVIVAIIGVLISMLLPALGRTGENMRRVLCTTNQREAIKGWALYASDHDGEYPTFKFRSSFEHIHWLYKLDIASQRYDYGIDFDWVIACPNRDPVDWRNYARNEVIRISYFIMVGRETGRLGSLSGTDPNLGAVWVPWESPRHMGRGGGRLAMLSDIDEYRTGSATRGGNITSVSHTFNGSAYGPPNTAMWPQDLGSEGGNVGYEDMSVRFLRVKDRHPRKTMRTGAKTGFW